LATTGFWPVKNRLKEVIDYADNPDKTTERKYLDNDLAAALEYAENDDKTDKKVFVTGINCITKKAYEKMTASKQRYGKLGGNVAYHGYQSFRTGEVTPEECHQIGIETAKRMWGYDYEIVVTTHLNTNNLHNHIVVNSVSFRTGRKFENHISDHHKLREISDAVCQKYGKSVIENAKFYGGDKKTYWLHKEGKLTHRDMLKADIEEVLKYSKTRYDFESRLKALGYTFGRTEDDYRHPTVIAKGWKRPIRIDTLGYTVDVINARMEENENTLYFFRIQNEHPIYRPKQFPLEKVLDDLQFEIEHSYDAITVFVDTLFLLVLTVFEIIDNLSGIMLLSPELRHAKNDYNKYYDAYAFLKHNDIHTLPELSNCIIETKAQIADLEAVRQKISNQIRRPKSPEEQAKNKERRKAISAQIQPLRKKLRRAEWILEKSPHLYELLQTEHHLEQAAKTKYKQRSYER
jgi:hypothetical protein